MNWLDFLKEGETTVDVPQEAPDVLVVKAIVDRDLASLKKAISLGGSVRQTIGKEKFAVFAFRHFDKDVINFLQKEKVSFKDYSKLIDVVIANDDITAFDWMLDQKNFSHIFDQSIDCLRDGSTTPFPPSADNHGYISGLMHNLVSNGSAKCLERFKNIDAEMLSWRVKSWTVLAGLMNVLKKGDEKLCDIYCDITFKKIKNTTSIKFGVHEISTFSIPDLAQLDRLIQKGTLQASIVRFDSEISVTPQQAPHVKKLGVAILPSKTPYSYPKIAGAEISNLSDAVMASGSSVCAQMAKTPAGQKILCDFLGSEKNMLSFAHATTMDVFFTTLKNCPDLVQIRDNGNHPFHYFAAFANNITASTIGKMAALDKEAIFLENNQGFSVSSLAPADALAGVSKRMMKGAVKEVVKEKPKKAPARRM